MAILSSTFFYLIITIEEARYLIFFHIANEKMEIIFNAVHQLNRKTSAKMPPERTGSARINDQREPCNTLYGLAKKCRPGLSCEEK